MKNLKKHESSATFYPLSKIFFFTGGDNMITLWGKKVKIVREILFLVKRKKNTGEGSGLKQIVWILEVYEIRLVGIEMEHLQKNEN